MNPHSPVDPDIERILERSRRLSPAQQHALACWLIESLDGEPDPDAAQAWEVETNRRLAELDSGAVQAIDFEEFRRRLLGDTPPPSC